MVPIKFEGGGARFLGLGFCFMYKKGQSVERTKSQCQRFMACLENVMQA